MRTRTTIFWLVVGLTTALLWITGSRGDSFLARISVPATAECNVAASSHLSSQAISTPMRMAHQLTPAAPTRPNTAPSVDAAEPVDTDDFSKERFAPPAWRTPFQSPPCDHLRAHEAVASAYHLPSLSDASPLGSLRSVLLLI